MEPVLVLGVGNILLRDEGTGVRVVQALEKQEVPPGVELLDGGTAGVGLINAIAGRRKVIIIDACKGTGEPGTVYRLTAGQLAQHSCSAISLHECGLLEALNMAKQTGCAPGEVVVFGIQPKTIALGLELSPEIKKQVPVVIECVLNEVGR